MSEPQQPEHNWWTLVAVCGATFMLLVDITIVQVALPSIHDDLHASFTQLQWVLDAYALSLASLLLTYGTLADRFGRKRVFVFGVGIFTLASLLCGLADSGLQLDLARAFQGIGGAAMFTTALALIAQDFSGHARGTAMAFWGVSIATFAIGAGMFAAFPYVTLYLQNLLGYSPLQGGLRLLPSTVLVFFVPIVARRFGQRVRSGLMLGAGMTLVALGLLLM